MIVGLTGKNAAGKGEVARFLSGRSFRLHSLSDELRLELERTATPVTRENLIERGRALRAEFGPGVLADRVLARIDDASHHVVDSIRNPGEIAVLRHHEARAETLSRLLDERQPLPARDQTDGKDPRLPG